jgi:glucosamine-phosphate N-acetyltransferase
MNIAPETGTLLLLLNDNEHYVNKIKMSYLSLLSQLSDCPIISDIDFVNKIKNISAIDGTIFILFFGDIKDDNFRIVASGTILIEPKIIHNSSVGHIEDVVVDNNFRGHGLAKNILNRLKKYAFNHKNVYKVILDCDEELVQFYNKNDFKVKGVQMAKYN